MNRRVDQGIIQDGRILCLIQDGDLNRLIQINKEDFTIQHVLDSINYFEYDIFLFLFEIVIQNRFILLEYINQCIRHSNTQILSFLLSKITFDYNSDIYHLIDSALHYNNRSVISILLSHPQIQNNIAGSIQNFKLNGFLNSEIMLKKYTD